MFIYTILYYTFSMVKGHKKATFIYFSALKKLVKAIYWLTSHIEP